ncbi:hypothetical protein [Stigmatella aurantiaca]|nr:hypothetical protein [Stigmatella aurantiaca]ADO69328.1 uncharacterized protein STAUR_1524 [Stigmatella aurantiaca DW4/3-1]
MNPRKMVGFFRKLAHGQATGPALSDRRGAPLLDDHEQILHYLRSGKVSATAGGLARDVLDPAQPIIGPLYSQTDGMWLWPSDLPYYFEKYNVLLDEAFLAHVRARQYTPG